MIAQVITLINGAVLGLSLAAPPGAMNALIAEQSVIGGWDSGFRAGLGAMTADLCFLLLTFFGVASLVNRSSLIHASLLGVGGVVMVYFAIEAIRNANTALMSETSVEKETRAFTKAFVLAITNPYQIIWWLTIGIALLEPGEMEVIGYSISTGSYLIMLGLFLGILIWIITFPLALGKAKDKIQELEYVVAYISALVLGGFGIIFLYNSITNLF